MYFDYTNKRNKKKDKKKKKKGFPYKKLDVRRNKEDDIKRQ